MYAGTLGGIAGSAELERKVSLLFTTLVTHSVLLKTRPTRYVAGNARLLIAEKAHSLGHSHMYSLALSREGVATRDNRLARNGDGAG